MPYPHPPYTPPEILVPFFYGGRDGYVHGPCRPERPTYINCMLQLAACRVQRNPTDPCGGEGGEGRGRGDPGNGGISVRLPCDEQGSFTLQDVTTETLDTGYRRGP